MSAPTPDWRQQLDELEARHEATMQRARAELHDVAVTVDVTPILAEHEILAQLSGEQLRRLFHYEALNQRRAGEEIYLFHGTGALHRESIERGGICHPAPGLVASHQPPNIWASQEPCVGAQYAVWRGIDLDPDDRGLICVLRVPRTRVGYTQQVNGRACVLTDGVGIPPERIVEMIEFQIDRTSLPSLARYDEPRWLDGPPGAWADPILDPAPAAAEGREGRP